jgi:hypothetical protein
MNQIHIFICSIKEFHYFSPREPNQIFNLSSKKRKPPEPNYVLLTNHVLDLN